MLKLSIVDDTKIQKDPTKLAYLFPRIPAARFKQQCDEYYRNYSLRVIEDVAKQNGMVVVPASCISPRNREADKRINLFGKFYYLKDPAQLTAAEKQKYIQICQDDDYEISKRFKKLS